MALLGSSFEQAGHIHTCTSVTKRYKLVAALQGIAEVTAGMAESNGSLPPGLWHDSLHVTCGLTVCTPGSAPDPTLGSEYGRTLPCLCHAKDVRAKPVNQLT